MFECLQDDDAVNAETYINKASFLVNSSQNEVLNLQYKVGPPLTKNLSVE